MTTDRVAQQQLVAKGEAQGFITYDDILSLVPSADQDVEALEDLMEELTRAGIEVLSEPPPAEPQEIPQEPSEEDLDLEDIGPIELDLVQDAGYQQAIDTDDVVGLYLKEAGRVPLLRAEEEVSLAKRMEAGKFAQEHLKRYDSTLTPDERQELQNTIDDAEQAQEHLVRANSRLVISVAKKYIGR